MTDGHTTYRDAGERLGISRPELRAILKRLNLAPPANQPHQGLPESTLQAVAEWIAKDTKPTPDAPTAVAELPPSPEFEVLEVVVYRSAQQGIRNQNIVLAHPSVDRDKVLTVRVKDNTNYIPGMKFHARFQKEVGLPVGYAWDIPTNSAAPAPRSRGRL